MFFSPFSAVLRSNYAASGIEALHIKQIITKHDADIVQINKEIAQTQITLIRLQHRRAGLVAFRQAHEALMSPIRRTPPEILAKIFLLCLPDDEFVGMDVSQAPLLILQICSRWREIALSTPRLWNSISVYIGRNDVCDDNLDCRPFGKKQLIKVWLSRSGNLPLNIKILYAINHYDDLPPDLDDFVDIFIPFSSRWFNLHLDLPQLPIEQLVCNSSVSTPNLEILTLDIVQLQFGPTLVLTHTAIRLQKVTLLNCDLIPYYIQLPWSQLMELRTLYDEVELESCLDILQLCLNLTHLSLRYIGDVSDAVSHPMVVMPRLSWLELESLGPFRPLLDKLVVPSLREIIFRGRAQWHKSELLPLIYRSSSPLEILSINQSREVARADIDGCFESIQTLREVSITSPWDGKKDL
jgi:hypothetical protein